MAPDAFRLSLATMVQNLTILLEVTASGGYAASIVGGGNAMAVFLSAWICCALLFGSSNNGPEEIAKAWKARLESTRSLKVVVQGNHTILRGAFNEPENPSKDPVPPKDIVCKIEKEIIIDFVKGHYAISTSEEQYDPLTKGLKNSKTILKYDGNRLQGRSIILMNNKTERVGEYDVTLADGYLRDNSITNDLYPVFHTAGILSSGRSSPYPGNITRSINFSDLKPDTDTTGSLTFRLEEKVYSASTQFVFGPSPDYFLHAKSDFHNGVLLRNVALAYTTRHELESWEATDYAEHDKRKTHFTKLRVTSLERNIPTKLDDFVIPLQPGDLVLKMTLQPASRLNQIIKERFKVNDKGELENLNKDGTWIHSLLLLVAIGSSAFLVAMFIMPNRNKTQLARSVS